MISCPKCAKDNQDHYKFCLGCGAELPRDAAPKPFTPQTPPHGMKAVGGAAPAPAPAHAPAPAYAPAPAAAPAPAPVAAPAPPPVAPAPAAAAPAPAAGTVCPQCGHNNTGSNMFCGSCGFRLSAGPSKAPSAAPPAAPIPIGTGPSVGVTLTALRADGTEAGTFSLPAATTVIGRDLGGIFQGDSYLSPRHGTFKFMNGRLTIKDEGSLNGVYRKLVRDVPVELRPNDIFRIGQEIIKFEPLQPEPKSPDGVERLGSPSKGYIGRIALVIGRDTSGNAFPIPEGGIHLGRERGDVLFPEDGYVSGLHCRLSWDGSRLLMTDLGSSNGSFIRLREETEVRTGDILLMGQQLFRIAMG